MADELVSLAACPIGLFMCSGELCLKTEYGNNEGRIDAYIVSSGEFFWGDNPQTIASQRAQLVTPVREGDFQLNTRATPPAEPTEAMIEAGARAMGMAEHCPEDEDPWDFLAIRTYRAMIAAREA